tara:strand:+ start:371 stop:574 length:204 start_codon:yes stop_codon:yes gene_type:complete
MKVYCVHDRLTQLKHYWPKLKDAYQHRNLDPEYRDVEIIEYNYQHQVADLLQKAYERGREDEQNKQQ